MLITDLLYSLKHRLEITSDSYALEENPFLKNPVHNVVQLPKRATFTLGNCVLSGYTVGDVENLQAVVSALVSVKPLLVGVREKFMAVEKKSGGEEVVVIPSQSSHTRFIYSIAAVFAVLILSFLMRNYN